MLWDILCAAAGLFAGWWFLPQPEWAKTLYSKIFKSSEPTTPAQ